MWILWHRQEETIEKNRELHAEVLELVEQYCFSTRMEKYNPESENKAFSAPFNAVKGNFYILRTSESPKQL